MSFRRGTVQLSAYTRRKCFISYHHSDEREVESFIQEFDHARNVFIARGIGASMPGDVIDSKDRDYIMRRVRDLYLRDSTVTIVMIGKCTHARKYVDWEIASSLRNDSKNRRSGLIGIVLPSAANSPKEPPRLGDNLGSNGSTKYARWYTYPKKSADLARMVEDAYQGRSVRVADNSRLLFSYNRTCS
ncbi:TIR domain-containing protein [Streptomyces hokutonensis]|uniref:TIR domain-containing protein n=1 Tax=Streptomyces hokutonensis TaxID=1306990 RepID=UPI000998E5DE|nr:TIR domain-containing protein [Streptomyces hokutonensis]